jgi:catechol 2,3-dioxygenase-like lactoylglutathione lyase family enzyme
MAGSERLLPVAPEFFVPDIERSIAFYKQLGFVALRQEPDFAVIALHDDVHILLAAGSLIPGGARFDAPRGGALNVRIMVDDVDGMYQRAKAAGARIVHEIGDRYYGLRDFILADPDGFMLRFAAPLKADR